eukprot:1068330-Heterocapsa_arctica.AAC.1
MLEDVLFCPFANDFRAQLLDTALQHEEYVSVSIDCTFRCMFSLRGQASYRAPRVVRRQQAFPEEADIMI